MKSSHFLATVVCLLYSIVAGQLDVRPVVFENVIQDKIQEFAFVNEGGKLLCQQRNDQNPWTGTWVFLPSQAGSQANIVSNPAVARDPILNLTRVVVLASDGNVWTSVQQTAESSCKQFTELKPIPLPNPGFNPKANVTLHGKDNVNVLTKIFGTSFKLYIFVRTIEKQSRLMYTVYDGKNYTSWFNTGGMLISDVTVVLNPFSNFFEAFAFHQDGKLHRTWMYDDKTWANWRVCGDSQPSLVPTHKPVALSMSPTIFNGMTEVFALGTDGKIHHIWQTTCDHVKNPWGYCTWGLWYSIGSQVPSLISSVNSVAGGHNIHLGNEIFVLDYNGSLWHLWQLQRDGDWHGWEKVGDIPGKPNAYAGSLPFVKNSQVGWWTAYVLDRLSVLKEITQFRSLATQTYKVAYGSNLTVQWSVPIDEATHKDWIGIYPTGMDNQKYVDYRYVQGTQNPLKDSVPSGKIVMQSFLPDGDYQLRYLVNRKFVNVMQLGVSYYNSSKELDWVLMYRGIARGLGKQGTNFTACVKDGNLTIQTFKAAFDSFENRQIFKGLQLFGQGLKDVQMTLQQCGETKIVERLEKFVKDLISCTENNCVNFIFDLVEELVILYEDVYEIFGDIRAASNALNLIKGYEQGGLCIGRVVAACISLPS